MTEEIYINDELLDLDASFKGVQMIFQSPYLTDFQSIVSNRTNSVTFPATNHNRAIIGCVSLQQDSVFPYRKHRAIYKRDGVQMFNGKATLLSVTDKQIQMCFTWGNTDAFQKLFDTNLRELDLGRSSYPATLLNHFENYIPLINFGGLRGGVGVSVERVLSAIQTKCGVTGLTSLASFLSNSQYVLALTTRNGDTTTREKQGLQFGTFTARMWKVNDMFYLTTLRMGSNGSDPHGWLNNEYGIINVSEFQELKLDIRGSFSKNQYGTGYSKHTMKLIFDAGDGWDYDNGITLCTPNSSLQYSVNYSGVIDVSNYERVAIAITADIGNYDVTLSNVSMSQDSVVPDPSLDDEVIYGTGINNTYPIGLNLPDMSCGQFIKNLLWLRGEFAFSQDGKTFEFASFNDLITNKSKALDWTDKMITLSPKERQTKLDGTARKNYFRYKEADWYDNAQYQGVLTTDDETIEAEKDYCKSDFALIPDNKIPVWSLNDEGEWDFAGDNLPPVLVSGYGIITVMMMTSCYNSAQRWANVLSRYYEQYAAMIQHPVVIKADFLVTTADLNALDMRVPVYLKQTGRYYAIRKLTTKNAKVSEAELIELK